MRIIAPISPPRPAPLSKAAGKDVVSSSTHPHRYILGRADTVSLGRGRPAPSGPGSNRRGSVRQADHEGPVSPEPDVRHEAEEHRRHEREEEEGVGDVRRRRLAEVERSRHRVTCARVLHVVLCYRW